MNREILLEMYEELWNADKDKWAWNVILKDTLEKEKEQIMDAYEVSHISMMTAEQYYNETFNTKENG